jgi:hypothetical protein
MIMALLGVGGQGGLVVAAICRGCGGGLGKRTSPRRLPRKRLRHES